jgi:hypothetical protein
MPIVQLHHEMPDGTKPLVAQQEVTNMEQMQAFFQETEKAHPLPAGGKWLAVTDKHSEFIMTLAHPGDHIK